MHASKNNNLLVRDGGGGEGLQTIAVQVRDRRTKSICRGPLNLLVLYIGRFACSVMRNTTVTFKNAKFDNREKIFGKSKNNLLCQCCELNYAYSAIF